MSMWRNDIKFKIYFFVLTEKILARKELRQEHMKKKKLPNKGMLWGYTSVTNRTNMQKGSSQLLKCQLFYIKDMLAM